MGQADRGRTIGVRRRITTAMIAAFALVAGTLALADATPVAAGNPIARLVYVAGTNGPPNGDKPVVAMAEDLGFDVIVLDDDTPNLASIVESFTPAVIVVSSSVTPNKIDDMFTDSPRPVVTWEPYIFDDLGLTETGGGNRGEGSSATAIRIVDSTHPITAPLSGDIAITSNTRPQSYGVPAGDVQMLATTAGSNTRAGIMVANPGDALAEGVAAGVRVGLFMSWSSPPVLTDNGRAIVGKAISWAGNFVPPAPNLAPVVDAGADVTIMLPNDTVSLDATVTDDGVQLATPAITWTGPAGAAFDDANSVDTDVTFADAGSYVLTITADDGELQTSDDVHVTVQDPAAPVGTEVIFVVGDAGSPGSNDQVIEAKLLAAGLDVTFVDDDALPADLTGVDGVVISTSVKPSKVGATFTNIDIPILTWEGYLLDDLGLSDGPNGETPKARKTINIVDPAHPLAAGYSGYTSVITSSRRMAYGTPGAAAEVVAFDGSPNANRAVLFAYLTDALLPGGGTATARRVVVFPNYGGTGLLTSFGMDIMDAAIAFFLVPDNEPPTVDDQSLDIDENSPNGTVAGTISFDDPDLGSGDVVTVSVTGGTGVTAFDVSAAGEVTVADVAQLDHETTSSFTLDVTVTDTAGETDTAVVTIDVNDINDAPVALDDFPSATEDAGFGADFLFNDTDEDGDALTITSANGAPVGSDVTITTTDGRVATFRAEAGPKGAITFLWPLSNGAVFNDLAVGETDTANIGYEISDGRGGTDSAQMTVTINGQNDAPTAVDDDFTVAQDVLLAEDLLSNDTDPDTSDVLTITGAGGQPVDTPFGVTSVGGRSGFATVNAGGAVNFMFDQDTNFMDLALGETDTVEIDYDISDGNGGTDTGLITIIVNGENDAPIAVNDFVTTSENGGFTIDPLFGDTDPDGDAFFLNSVEGLAPGSSGTVTTTGGRTASFSSIAGVQGVSRIVWPSAQGVFDDLNVGDTDQALIDYQISDGSGGFASATLTVTINGAANPPVAAHFGVTAIGNTQLRAGTGETGPVSPPAKIVTNNLVTASTNAVSATAATGQATTQGGFVDINTNGSFVYTPPTGFTGADTFTYEVVSADLLTATGTVTVTVADLVWYVSDPGSSGNTGRSHEPMYADFLNVAGPGDIVYFFPSTSNYDTDGYQPLTGQTWIGAGVPLVVDGVTLAAAGTAPTLRQTSGTSADVTMRGMTIDGLYVSGGADRLTLSDVAITRYLILGNLADVSIDITSFAGPGVVNITNVTGTKTFGSFNTTYLGSEVVAGLNLVNAGTVTINGTTNTIDTPNKTAIRITDTTLSGSGPGGAMQFQSVIGQNIEMNNVTGGFTLSGDATETTCGGDTAGTCSGGTVGSVSLTNAGTVSLNKLKVLNSGDDAVTVTGNSNVSIVDSEIIGAGDAPDEDGIVLSQTGGSFTLMDSLVTGFHDTGIRGLTTTGTATVTIDGNHFSDNHEVVGSGGDGENAIDIRTQGGAQLTVNVTDNVFDDIEGSAVKIVNESGGASIDANVIDNVISDLGGTDDFPTFPAIELITDNLGSLTFDVQSNEITNIPGTGIRVAGEGAISGRIGGTTVALGNTVNGTTLGDGIELDLTGENVGDNFVATILVQRNTLQNLGTAATSSVRGIQILHRDNLGTMNLTIDNNEISNVRDEGIRFFADHDGGVGQGNPVSNVRIANNAFAGIPVDEEVIRVSSSDTAATCAHIVGNSGFDAAPADEISLPLGGTATLAITQASIAALITANPGAAVTAAPGITFNGGCTNPTLPTNP